MSLSDTETILKIAALVAGAAFFLWKLLTGWLIVNLKLSASAIREQKDSETDYLAIAITLEKGTTDSVWIKDISVRVTPEGHQSSKLISVEGFRRLKVANGKLDWSTSDPIRTEWPISPGEALQLGVSCTVPCHIPAAVEVAAYGRRPFWTPGFQWRASLISLPKSKSPAAK